MSLLPWLKQSRKRWKLFRLCLVVLSLLFILVIWSRRKSLRVPDEILAFEAGFLPEAGLLGGPHRIPGQSEADIKAIVKKHAFNKAVSDQINVVRNLRDYRHVQCQRNQTTTLTASVILIFNGEALSALLRTVWSILRTSPPELLHEIVLLDDGSTSEELIKVLPLYVKHRLPSKVHLHRLPKQTGLIQARTSGAKFASGDVIVFLDSHCEATTGWLPPLLGPIAADPSTITLPTIDHIHDITLSYSGYGGGSDVSVGSFTWSGHFSWAMYIPPVGKAARSPAEPVPSPTMAGGLFAIGREFFWKLGGYDEQMIGWGGENLELSFRVWTCHGRMLAVPCSHVGHIFRSFHPYFIPEDSHGFNTMRMAEVWMDDYKRFFYLYRTELQAKLSTIGDLSQRKSIKEKLHCKPFSWYLSHVIPDKFRMDEEGTHWGRVRSAQFPSLCLDHLQRDRGHDKQPYKMGQYPCHTKMGSSQYFVFSKEGSLRNEYMCGSSAGNALQMVACVRVRNQNPKWTYTQEKQLKHLTSGACLTASGSEAGKDVRMEACRGNGYEAQMWNFEFNR